MLLKCNWTHDVNSSHSTRDTELPTSLRGKSFWTSQGYSSCLTEPTKNTSGLIRNEVEVRKTINARIDEKDRYGLITLVEWKNTACHSRRWNWVQQIAERVTCHDVSRLWPNKTSGEWDSLNKIYKITRYRNLAQKILKEEKTSPKKFILFVSSCEPGNKLSGSIMDDKFIEYLSNH
jgi:hypothetical protein